jgi:hypothetical protein
VPDQAEILEHDADPAAKGGKGLAWRLAQLLAEQADAPARRPLREIEKLQKRSFSGAGRAGQKIKSAAGELKVEVAQNLGSRAVAQADRVEFSNCWQLPSLPDSTLGYAPCQAPSITVYRALTVPEEGF